MLITDKMLAAALRKGIELGLLTDEDGPYIRQIFEAALAAADDVPESRLEAEHSRAMEAERERDAITRLLVVESLSKGSGWYVQDDLPPKVKGRYQTFEEAVAVVRKAAGLDPAPGKGGDHP